ncbi:MAG TPA: class I fructose-bisphosphate aldolase [Candidatus Krumholzibacteria bacterium]|nr:class I fructose-bisphosphate aldolase [Candidatus Krumholzibacteria bacterium]
MAQSLKADTSRAVDQILDHYRSENPGVRANLYRMLTTGRLAGTGKMVILPVDQGFEHGPARSFAANPGGYDPAYHAQLAIDAGCNAYAAPYGFISQVAHEYAGKIPLILKVNNHDVLCDENDPAPAQTSGVQDALRLGCAAIGFTIYPGSAHWKAMYENLRALSEEARNHGIAVVVWSYPRGSGISKDGETAIDVVAYAAQIAAQLGAHVIKVKLPTDHLEQDAAKKVYLAEKVKIASLADRVKHVMDSSFAGKRIVVFSGGGKKGEDAVFDEARAIRDGGGNGSIIGRNSFQRPRAEAVKFLQTIMDIYAGKID